jgi:hypothetical protein
MRFLAVRVLKGIHLAKLPVAIPEAKWRQGSYSGLRGKQSAVVAMAQLFREWNCEAVIERRVGVIPTSECLAGLPFHPSTVPPARPDVLPDLLLAGMVAVDRERHELVEREPSPA